MPIFEHQSEIPVSADDLFDWHARKGAFQRLTPPWEKIAIISQSGGIEDGARAELEVRIGPIKLRWMAEHSGFVAGRQFRDIQVGGPFKEFEHTHRILPQTERSCILQDHIEFRLPLGCVGQLLGGRYVRRKLERTFRYRHEVTRHDIQAHAKAEGKRPMKVLVTGATGLVGTELVPFLTTGGHEVHRLVRSGQKEAHDISWNPETGDIPLARREGLDAVIHLAGENIAKHNWSARVKERIRKSRVDVTKFLCTSLAKLQRPPKAFLCASAIGFYGDRGSELVNETSGPGTGFLADVCQQWEAACQPARDAGMRVVNLRIGVVLSPKGGALAAMLPPFKMGVGGPIGSGHQYWSWIAIDDVVGAILHCLVNDRISGPVDLTSPNPLMNEEFTRILGKVLGRPTIFQIPAIVARLLKGEMATELLLSSNRVTPNRLCETGYQFRYPQLKDALCHLLGK